MGDSVEIRPATTADVDGVAASCAALFAEDAAARDHLRDQTWPSGHAASWCRDLVSDPAALVLVASGDSGVVGHLVGTYAEPSPMWTAPRAELVSIRFYQRHGFQPLSTSLAVEI